MARPRRCRTKPNFIHVILILMPTKVSMGENGTGCICSNKGIDGKNIFVDESDYDKFAAILRHYLLEYVPDNKPGFKNEKKSLTEKKKKRNLAKEVKLFAFCLRPNYYELLIIGSATKLIRRICTHYCMYFNKKYKRRGPLFEGRFKTRFVEKEQFSREIERIELESGAKVVRRFGPISATIMPVQPSKSENMNKLEQIVKMTKFMGEV